MSVLILAGVEPINHDGVVEVGSVVSVSPTAVGNEKPAPTAIGSAGAFGNRGGRCRGDIVGIEVREVDSSLDCRCKPVTFYMHFQCPVQ